MVSYRLRWSLLISAAVLALGILVFAREFRAQGAKHERYDLLIVKGHIVDGTGSPWFEGSVAIRNGKIAEIGRIGDATAARTIDAHDLIVAPGFIDLHSHSDFTLLSDGKAESKIREGVTTEIIGEAASAGPVVGAAATAQLDAELASIGQTRSWSTLGDYFSVLQKHGTAVNIASYVGSGQVRLGVMGNVNRAPTAAELDQMKSLVDQAMRDGAIGISSGLIYPPNLFATTDELVELAKVAARYGGIYTTHIRDESDHEPEALRQAIEIGERAGLPVHILHFKVAAKQNWGRIGEMIAIIQTARDRGVDVTVDQYPYIASMTGLQMTLPAKYLEGTHQQVIERLRAAAARDDIRRLVETGMPGQLNQVRDSGGWHGVMVASTQKPENKQFEGKRMDEVARMTGKDPVDALCDILISEETFPEAIYFEMSEEDVRGAMREPWLGFGSDGSAVNPSMKFIGRPHPRFYGTFPRVLGVYVREEKVLTLPDAIRKMTSLPAQITGLGDRGVLRAGMAADITIFDPATVTDKATFEEPSQYPAGIPYVVVNGTIVIDQGRHTGALPGRILYGRGKQAH